MMLLALPNFEARSLASLGVAPGGAEGVSLACSRWDRDKPRLLSPPIRSHSRRETRSASDAVRSRMESMPSPSSRPQRWRFSKRGLSIPSERTIARLQYHATRPITQTGIIPTVDASGASLPSRVCVGFATMDPLLAHRLRGLAFELP